jgi:hypothetical protein
MSSPPYYKNYFIIIAVKYQASFQSVVLFFGEDRRYGRAKSSDFPCTTREKHGTLIVILCRNISFSERTPG